MNLSASLQNLVNLGNFYDVFFSDPLYAEFYGGSGYANFGFWPHGVDTAAAAGDALVDLILEPVPPELRNDSLQLLDVACGHGATTRRLCRSFSPRNITGVGMDGSQLAQVKRRAPDCTFRRMDATQCGFADESFDVVVCVEAAFHFKTRQDFFAEAWRLLRPGGYLVLSDLMMARRAPLMPPENYVPSLAAYAQQMTSAGYAQVQVEDLTDCTWHAFRSRFNAFATAHASRFASIPAVRDLYTVNVNTSWATQAYITAVGVKQVAE